MAKMKVKVTMNQQKVRQLSQAQIQAVKMTGEQMLHEIVSDQVIPFDTGNLQNVGTYVETKEANKGKVSIVHDTPYASKVYFHPEYNFQKTFNVNARGEWWEAWLTGAKKNRPHELFRKFYKRITGG